MRCIRCNTEWDTDVKIKYPDKCPFCGTVIRGIQQDAAGILHDIVEKYGAEILSYKEVLSDAITEYLSYVEINAYDQLALIRSAVEEGVGDILSPAVGKEIYWWNKQNKLAINHITATMYVNEDTAKTITEPFAFALGFKKLHVKKEYHDKDCAYYNLSQKYREVNTDLANSILIVSAKTGNISAISEVVGEMYGCWQEYIDAKTWFQWCTITAEQENDFSIGAEYEITLAKLYGIGTKIEENQALEELRLYEKDYLEAKLEISARCLCGALSFSYSIEEAIDAIHVAAEAGLSFAPSIDRILRGKRHWIAQLKKAQYSSKEGDNYYQSHIAFYIAEYFKYSREKEKRKAWLEIAAKKGNNEAKLEIGLHLIESEKITKRKLGYSILETTDLPSAQYIVAKELQRGVLVKRDFKKAFDILCNYDSLDFLFMRGKAYYYGWGCEVDIERAIECFDYYINEAAKKSEAPETLTFHEYLALPFLIQLYYEDMIQNDNMTSLRKLEDLAGSSKCQMALRYLHKWYLDPDNPHHNAARAKSYLRQLNKYEEGLFVEKSAISGVKDFYRTEYREYETELNMRKKSEPTYSDYAVLYQNHLLLEVIKYWEFEYEYQKAFFDTPENMYVRMAYLLTQEDIGFVQNNLRAYIFYDLFLEKGMFSDKNYKPASIQYALIIIDHYLTKSKIDKALQYLSKNVATSEEGDDVDKMMIWALINASLKTLEQKDLGQTEEYLKRALKLC